MSGRGCFSLLVILPAEIQGSYTRKVKTIWRRMPITLQGAVKRNQKSFFPPRFTFYFPNTLPFPPSANSDETTDPLCKQSTVKVFVYMKKKKVCPSSRLLPCLQAMPPPAVLESAPPSEKRGRNQPKGGGQDLTRESSAEEFVVSVVLHSGIISWRGRNTRRWFWGST